METITRTLIFDDCKDIWTLLKDFKRKWPALDQRLQAYLVPFATEIASILGPYSFQLLLSLQTYLVHVIKNYCKHISIPIKTLATPLSIAMVEMLVS